MAKKKEPKVKVTVQQRIVAQARSTVSRKLAAERKQLDRWYRKAMSVAARDAKKVQSVLNREHAKRSAALLRKENSTEKLVQRIAKQMETLG